MATERDRYRTVVSQAYDKLLSGNKEVSQYCDSMGKKNGQIAFALDHDIDHSLGIFFSSLNKKWINAFGWTKINMSRSDAISIRSAVEQVCHSSNGDFGRFADRSGSKCGQVRFVQEHFEGTNFGQFYSALDRPVIKALGWRMINLPFVETIRIRLLVESLIASPEATQFQGVTGMIEFLQVIVTNRQVRALHIGAIYSSLDQEWLTKLKWKKISLPLSEAFAHRRSVQTILNGSYIGNYTNSVGLIRYVHDGIDSGSIKSTNLGHIITVLDKGWISELNWRAINMSYQDALGVIRLLDDLIESNRSDVKGLGNMVEFFHDALARTEITTPNLGPITALIDDPLLSQLEWKRLKLPINDAYSIRCVVKSIMANGLLASYSDVTGMLKLVKQSLDLRVFRTSHLGQFYSVLDGAWVKTLRWPKIDLPFDIAWKAHEFSQTARVINVGWRYYGKHGMKELIEEQLQVASINSSQLAKIRKVFDKTLLDAMGW